MVHAKNNCNMLLVIFTSTAKASQLV